MEANNLLWNGDMCVCMLLFPGDAPPPTPSNDLLITSETAPTPMLAARPAQYPCTLQ